MKSEKDMLCPGEGAGKGEAYLLVRSRKRRRTISLELKQDGRAVIHAPWRTSRREMEDFFRKRTSWLAQRRSEMEQRRRESPPRAFVAGESFLFLGAPCRLTIADETNGVSPLTFSAGCFFLNRAAVSRAPVLFIAWYRARTEEYFARQVERFNGLLSLPVRGMRVSDARCRWGSCSHTNRLSFSWRLIMAPPSVIDYVVVHELAHIRHKNHGKLFYALIESVLPDHKERKKLLKG